METKMVGASDVPRKPPDVGRNRGGSGYPDLPQRPVEMFRMTSGRRPPDEIEDPAQVKPSSRPLSQSDDPGVQAVLEKIRARWSDSFSRVDGGVAESTPDPEHNGPERSEQSPAVAEAKDKAAIPHMDAERHDEPDERAQPGTPAELAIEAEPGPEVQPGEQAEPDLKRQAELAPEIEPEERSEPQPGTPTEPEMEAVSGPEDRPEEHAEADLGDEAGVTPELEAGERSEPEIQPKSDREMRLEPETRRRPSSETDLERTIDEAGAPVDERPADNGTNEAPVHVDITTATVDHTREPSNFLPHTDLHERRDVEKQQARLLNLIDRATSKELGLQWVNAPSGAITSVVQLVEVVREFAERLSAHPLVGSRLPKLAPDSGIACVQGYLDRIDGLLEELARLPAEIMLLPDARGRIRGGTRIPPLANVEIRDSRGVAVGADCYVYVLHRCEMTATVELVDVLAHDPDGIWLRWHDLSPFNADADTLAPRSMPLASPFSSAVDGCKGVTIGRGNSSTNVFEYRISCRQSARTYLAHPEVRTALRQCRIDGLTDAERDQARDALRARILSVAARLQENPEVINPEWRDLIPRGPVPKTVRRNGRIIVVNAKGVTVGYGNHIKGELQNRCEIVVR